MTNIVPPYPNPTFDLDISGVPPHQHSVDVIVCVHNALTDVQHCLDSLLSYTTHPWRLILVDDGSGEETADYLHDFAQRHEIMLLRNESARGYTLAANQGLRASNGKYAVLLNSDTIVSVWWLDRLIACAESDSRIGMVGPLSNTASWQSIPRIDLHGDWASNPLPTDMTVAQMANRLAACSLRMYPRLTFLNGFCLLIKQQLIEQIGYFDEETFGAGYGEENDYCLRARKAGWSLAVADDTYIYHAQSKSYSHERRHQLAEQSYQALLNKHGKTTIESDVALCRHSQLMHLLRQRAVSMLARWHLITEGQYRWQGRRVIFVVPVMEVGGGCNVVISEARAMRRMGVDAVILNFHHHKETFERSYPKLDVPVIYAVADRDIPEICSHFDAVIATANYSVDWIAPLSEHSDPPVLGYYVQDFEPWFYVGWPSRQGWFWRSNWLRRRFASWYFRKHADFRRAWISYLRIPDMIYFTKTRWNQQEIEKQVKRQCRLVGISFDSDTFSLRQEYPAANVTEQTPVRISAMIRPSSPRRGPKMTMQVLKAIQHKFGTQVEINLFGIDETDPSFQQLPGDFSFRNIGLCQPTEIADLFHQTDIFTDFSSFQAMGLTAMEAMACGTAVIVPQAGGSNAFAIHRKNALIVDTTSYQACYDALENLVTDCALRVSLMTQAAHDMVQFLPERVAHRILETLFDNF